MIRATTHILATHNLSNRVNNVLTLLDSEVDAEQVQPTPVQFIVTPDKACTSELFVHNKLLVSKLSTPLVLNVEKSKLKNGTLSKNAYVYDIPIDYRLHVVFDLVNENSRDFSKYYFLKDKNGSFFVNDLFPPLDSVGISTLFSHKFRFTASISEMETSPQKIKMYSMHVGNHTVKIKTYTIFLISHAGDKKGQLHIERKVTNTLFLDKEKKWTIDQDLRNIVVQGVRKRCYALRHIQKYYDAIN